MHWFTRVMIAIFGNTIALWLANRLVPGFVLTSNWLYIILIAIVLALLNFFLKPLFTLILGPIIILTLGLGILIVNAIILYLLTILVSHIDILHGTIMIQNIPALFYATLIISVINFLFHLAL